MSVRWPKPLHLSQWLYSLPPAHTLHCCFVWLEMWAYRRSKVWPYLLYVVGLGCEVGMQIESFSLFSPPKAQVSLSERRCKRCCPLFTSEGIRNDSRNQYRKRVYSRVIASNFLCMSIGTTMCSTTCWPEPVKRRGNPSTCSNLRNTTTSTRSAHTLSCRYIYAILLLNYWNAVSDNMKGK